jgi:hypothetical protein
VADEREDGGGCLGCVAVVLVVGAVVAGLISIAALIDPFDWMPTVGQVWEDCPEELESRDECDLAERFPGFWEHAVVNLLWTFAAGIALVMLFGQIGPFRQARRELFEGGQDAVGRYEAARGSLVGAAAAVMFLGALPIVVALL